MSFSFGIFDSFDQSHASAGQVLAERLEFAVQAESLGISHYHVTEHHGTPLSVCPSPNLFLAALSQRTTHMRMGALVLVLPSYEPLRLVEEIAILDQLTNGRLEIGVGSGISPYEAGYFGVAEAQMKPIYTETLELLMNSLGTGRVQHKGTLLRDYDVALSIDVVQRPHPPLWYASSNTRSADWAGTNGINFVGRWNGGSFAPATEQYWDSWSRAHDDAYTLLANGKEPRVGVSTTIVIGSSEQEALDKYHSAFQLHGERVVKLWHEHNDHRVDAIGDVEGSLKSGNAIVGTAATVRDTIVSQVENSSINYFETVPFFGDMTYDEGITNLRTLHRDVMPSVRSAAKSPISFTSTVSAR